MTAAPGGPLEERLRTARLIGLAMAAALVAYAVVAVALGCRVAFGLEGADALRPVLLVVALAQAATSRCSFSWRAPS